MSGHGESLSSVTPDQQRIPRKNIIKKPLDTPITGKEIIQEPENANKGAKKDSIPDVYKSSPKETHPPFENKVDYRGDTNEKTHSSDDFTGETDGCARNLDK